MFTSTVRERHWFDQGWTSHACIGEMADYSFGHSHTILPLGVLARLQVARAACVDRTVSDHGV